MGFDIAPGAATLLGAFSGANFFLGGGKMGNMRFFGVET